MLTLISPAKTNLFLRVLHKRSDGFHELASLFQALSLSDTIHYALSDQDILECSCPRIPTGSSNLVWKAVDLFRRKTDLSFKLHIKLEKKIPIEAGLGGGSSNAATTLWAINQLLGFPASESDLCSWSSEIGSDIPFFFSSGTAYCTGRGEIVQSLKPLSQETIWVAKPDIGLPTPQVYQNLNLSLLKPRDPLIALQSFENGKPEYFNDLEVAALSLKPQLHLFKQSLLDLGFKTVMLSGSGSSFICLGVGTCISLDCNHYQVKFLHRTDASWY